MPADASETLIKRTTKLQPSTCMPQQQPLCSTALIPNKLSGRDEGMSKSCTVIEAL